MRNVCSIGATARARLVPLSLTIVSVHDLSVHFYTAEFGVNERASEIYDCTGPESTVLIRINSRDTPC